jgi:hypothetical protein
MPYPQSAAAAAAMGTLIVTVSNAAKNAVDWLGVGGGELPIKSTAIHSLSPAQSPFPLAFFLFHLQLQNVNVVLLCCSFAAANDGIEAAAVAEIARRQSAKAAGNELPSPFCIYLLFSSLPSHSRSLPSKKIPFLELQRRRGRRGGLLGSSLGREGRLARLTTPRLQINCSRGLLLPPLPHPPLFRRLQPPASSPKLSSAANLPNKPKRPKSNFGPAPVDAHFWNCG